MNFIEKLFGKKDDEDANGIWNHITSTDDLDALTELSKDQPVVVFKHSTRCSISSMAKNRVDASWDIKEEEAKLYYLDLIQYRPLSNLIAERFNVIHESPQVIIVKEGKAVYHNSHNGITVEAIKEVL